MSDDTELEEDVPKKKSRMPLILGLVLALVGGGGGFFAVSQGLILGGGAEPDQEAAAPKAETLDTPPLELAFVPLDPLVISIRDDSGQAHLRFSAQLEVTPEYLLEVEALKPRIVDVLNGYLRAVSIAEMADPQSLARLRGQMLRRVQVVTGEGRVNDLLVMEFVLN